MRFWDSSALVPLFCDEPTSRACGDLLRSDPRLAVWTLAPLEVYAASCRKLREGSITMAELDRLSAQLGRLMDRCRAIDDSFTLREHARRLLRTHILRTADALQLAAALVWCDARPKGRMFVCRDARLLAAATAEGFDVIEPTALA